MLVIFCLSKNGAPRAPEYEKNRKYEEIEEILQKFEEMGKNPAPGAG